ncbi:hypothetical protein V6615_09340 [Oscillospiraceae bacterium PP1C4]
MNRKKWIYAAKHAAYILAIVLIYVAQTTPGFLTVFGVKPNFVIPAAVCIAMLEGEYIGGLYGAFTGLLCDLGGFVLFGFNSIILMVTCVIVGLLTIYMLRSGVINYILLLAGVLLTRGLLDYLLNYVMWGYHDVWMVLAYSILPSIIYTVAASPLVYYLFKWMYERFEEQIQA